jgi:hypothetical protein
MNFNDLPPEIRCLIQQYNLRLYPWDVASHEIYEEVFRGLIPRGGPGAATIDRLRTEFGMSYKRCYCLISRHQVVFEQLFSREIFGIPNNRGKIDTTARTFTTFDVHWDGSVDFHSPRNGVFGVFFHSGGRAPTQLVYNRGTSDEWRAAVPKNYEFCIELHNWEITVHVARSKIDRIPAHQLIDALVLWPRIKTAGECFEILNPYC